MIIPVANIYGALTVHMQACLYLSSYLYVALPFLSTQQTVAVFIGGAFRVTQLPEPGSEPRFPDSQANTLCL